MENKIAKITLTNALSTIAAFFVECAILMWVCAVLLPVFPWLAVIAGFTYWDWVAVNLGIKYVTRTVGALFRPHKS